MIHYVTVHFQSERWIDIQLRQIARHTRGDHKVWACLDGIGAYNASRFDVVYELEGDHSAKLNTMAKHVGETASASDLLVFMDGDAFPIRDFVARITALLPTHPLVAVQRRENLGDVQPHPCFCVTTVGFWDDIGGDWTRGGRPWFNTAGRQRHEPGGKVLERLEDLNVTWYPLLRTNKRDLHPVYFGVYGDVVYHHGSSFRRPITSVDRQIAGAFRWPRGVMAPYARWRLQRRERRNRKLSEWVYNEISRDDDFVKRFFMTGDHTGASQDVART